MIEDYFFIKNTKWVIWGGIAVLAGLLIFHAGYVVGTHEPQRGRMLLGGPGMDGQLSGFMPQQGFADSSHGAVGTIATVTLPIFTMQTRDGRSELVETGSSTVVTGGKLGTLADITSGQVVIIIGEPREADTDNGGDLDARIIHILPQR